MIPEHSRQGPLSRRRLARRAAGVFRHPHRDQAGAALMVAMIMIFMLSILGITSMRGARIEQQLTTNTIHKESTFQAAESASDATLATAGVLEERLCKQDAARIEQPDYNQSDAQETTTEVRYGGRTIALGYSIGSSIGASRFVVTANSRIDAVDTQTTISQGVTIIGAAGGSGDC